MYDEIFKVFDVVKSHFRKNGNTSFEESSVFELLENLYPVYGAAQTIAIVTGVQDAQRIRNCEDSSNESKVEILESDKSNDADSIIEVEVPQKIHPVVDLISNSPESDDAVIVENSTNQNVQNIIENNLNIEVENSSSGDSDNEYHGLSDPDVSKLFEDEGWNETVQNILGTSNATPQPDFLAMIGGGFKKPNSNLLEGEQSNPGIAEERENSEMLEENNNDPNNNLDGGVLEEEPVSNNNNALISEVTDSVPGCSKDTNAVIAMDFWSSNEKNLPNHNFHQSTSPVPGCSKDFDDSHNLESVSMFADESIQKDAICIQEIIPWANLDTIYSILKKHGNSPNRKQLTLWDLMSEVSSHMNTKVGKRKHNNDVCKVPKKSPKMNDVDESSLDLLPNTQSNNMACNESSNDSQSSKTEYNKSISSEVTDTNQKKHIFNSDTPKTLFFNKKDSRDSVKSIDSLNKSTNNTNINCIIMDETANLMPAEPMKNQFFNNSADLLVPKLNYNHHHSLKFADRPVRKERNETIVSGSLKDYSNTLPVHACVSPNDSESNKMVNGIKMLGDIFDNSSSKPAKNSEKELGTIKKELMDMADFFKNNEPFSREDPSIAKDAAKLKQNGAEIIKPSKLEVQQNSPVRILTTPTTTSYIRASNFSYTNTNLNVNQQKIAVRKDLGYQTLERLAVVNNKLTAIRQRKVSRVNVKSGSFSANIENPFSSKPKNEILTVKPVTAAEVRQRQALVPNSFWPGPALITSKHKPIAAPKLKTLPSGLVIEQNEHQNRTSVPKLKMLGPHASPNTNSIKPADPSKMFPMLDLPKLLPTATVTSSPMLAQTVNLENKPSTSGGTYEMQKIIFQPSTVALDPKIYNKLRSMFPDVRKSYVKKICMNPPGGAYLNKDQLLDALINHLLKEGDAHLRTINYMAEQEHQNKISTLSVDEKYEYLLGIFPDADPTYLRDFVEKSCSTEQILQEFIQQKLEKKDYPTKAQYLAKIKITEQIKQYTTDFKVEQFLELFPDPFKHFEDQSRKCDYQPIAMEFLKSFFNRNKVNTISRQYLQSGYNLSLTAKALSEIGSDMKSKRMTPEMPTENIPLLQEMAFVKNKKYIQNHVDTLKAKEEELFKALQEKNLLITCQCCFNDECMPTKSAECNSGHIFCFDCIIRGTESKLADGEAHVKCFTNCESEFSLATLQKILPPTTFSALLKKRQAAEIMAAGMDDLVSCPFCHFASIPPPEDRIFKCLNPECMKETCRQCKELNHIPLRCDEVIKTDKARHLIEEKMTQALLRTCYNCKKQFYKEDGCNKMQCYCGALMCYLCDKPVKGYSHFNPQGGSNTHLCPLWSDDRRLNAESVRKVAEEMKKAMQKANPNLEIDMDSLLPKLPPRSKGAHDDIPNANQLPDHVRRVAAP
ncbi:uncharacterized protein LOC100119259 [Nasonia vitripennis]|uniref:RING-type domain-containing protein n=1 Tax=Nasonia vitripennis TaxID=7425 RepID=A0A7M7LLT7_NASVI|nr:uncharacterized protein LOC100119259 [Nasonia vitripennis]